MLCIPDRRARLEWQMPVEYVLQRVSRVLTKTKWVVACVMSISRPERTEANYGTSICCCTINRKKIHTFATNLTPSTYWVLNSHTIACLKYLGWTTPTMALITYKPRTSKITDKPRTPVAGRRKCHKFCPQKSQDWGVKCKWTRYCAGCPECSQCKLLLYSLSSISHLK